MSSNVAITIGALSAFVVLSLLRRFRDNVKTLPLPPGPPSLPLIGNFFNMPTKDSPWVTFGALSEKYGT